MNLNQLNYFYKVCICGSLSEAAEHLYISQPSLSTAIKALEKEFGTKLFYRTHSGMRLTPEGKVLYESCKDLLSHAQQVENVMKDLGTQRSKLRLGIPPMIGSLILPDIYRDFCPNNPDIKLEITEDGKSGLMHKLSENQLDMIIMLQNNQPDESFSSCIIGQMEMVCCVSKENPIAKHKTVTPKILENVPLVLFENSFFQTEKVKMWFEYEKIEPNVIMKTKQLSTILAMIAQNVAAGFVFKEIAKSNDNFASLPCQAPMYADMSLVWNKNTYPFNSMNKFKNYLKEKNLGLYKP